MVFILWLALLDRLRTRKRLYKRGLIEEDGCIFCNAAAEIVDHLFFACEFAVEVSADVFLKLNVGCRECREGKRSWLGDDKQFLLHWYITYGLNGMLEYFCKFQILLM
ncbi:hypothetical protein Droror1_Dr00017673 [Drosera rotundifolia]